MRVDTVVEAYARPARGKNEARRLRVSGKIPAVIYGAAKDPIAVAVNPKDVTKILRGKSGHNAIFDVEIAGVERTPVILSDEQYDPVTSRLIHVDFRRIDLTRKLRVAVPSKRLELPSAIDKFGSSTPCALGLILEVMPSLCAQAAAAFTPTACSVLMAMMFIECASALRTVTSPLNDSSKLLGFQRLAFASSSVTMAASEITVLEVKPFCSMAAL